MSVATPWPLADTPPSSSTTLVSPSASWPPVTASTRNSRSRASLPVAALIARKIASTGPSPVNEPSTTSSSGVRTATVACGGGRVLASPSNPPRVWLGRAPRAGLDVEPLQRVAGQGVAQLVGDQRLEVHRRDLLLLVGDRLEALEGRVQRRAGHGVAQVLEGLAQRVAA